MIPRLHSRPAHLQALALVASPKQGSQHTCWPLRINSISFFLLWLQQYSYYPLERFFTWNVFNSLKCCGVLHFDSLYHGDHQVLILFHLCFCDFKNIHIIFLNLLLFWILKKNPSNHVESSIFIFYHLVTIKYLFYFMFCFCDLHNIQISLFSCDFCDHNQ